MKYFKDSSGAKVARMPLPQSWKVNPNYKDSLKIKTPKGVKVYESETINFAYAQDEAYHKMLLSEGFDIERFHNLEAIVKFTIPKYAEKGYTFVKSYPLPAYEKLLQAETKKLILPGGEWAAWAIAAEFKGSNNKSELVIIVQNKATIQTIDLWTINLAKLIAPTEVFENAKKTYIYALNNIQINPEVTEKINKDIKTGMQETASN